MAERLAPTIVTRLGEPCVNELKSSVENGLLKQEDCLKLAKEISKKVHKDVSDSINQEGYNASTVVTLLTSWFKHKPKEVCRDHPWSLGRLGEVERMLSKVWRRLQGDDQTMSLP